MLTEWTHKSGRFINQFSGKLYFWISFIFFHLYPKTHFHTHFWNQSSWKNSLAPKFHFERLIFMNNHSLAVTVTLLLKISYEWNHFYTWSRKISSQKMYSSTISRLSKEKKIFSRFSGHCDRSNVNFQEKMQHNRLLFFSKI